MDFIVIPIVVGIITYGIYSIFELFARKKERQMFIEKLGCGSLNGDVKFGKIEYSSKFSALKWAGLLLGIGLGLLAGSVIGDIYVPYDEFLQTTRDSRDMYYRQRELLGIIYGSCCLLGGGIGLLGAFLAEYKLSAKLKK